MKYLVNRETKEHRIASEQTVEAMTNHPAFNEGWQLVEANDEGWIGFKSTKCPVPYGSKCDVVLENGDVVCVTMPEDFKWGGKEAIYDVCLYRPILSEAAENQPNKGAFAASESAPCGIAVSSLSAFDRLKSAVAASESIPGIIAEIAAMLPEGYCVVKSEAQPAEDMSDWRNWREGDFVECISKDDDGNGRLFGRIEVGEIKAIEAVGNIGVRTVPGSWGKNGAYRFHSRPAKESV